MVIDVEGQGQALREKGAGEEVEMGWERLARIEAHEREQAAVVVDEFEHGRLGRQ